MADADQDHQQQGRGQVGCDDGGGEEQGHGQGPEAALERHQNQAGPAEPGQPAGQLPALDHRRGRQHQHAHAHDKGIKPVKPLQKNLQVHLATGQETAVTERPIGTGQAGLHHPGRPANHHQGYQGDYEVGGQQLQLALQPGSHGVVFRSNVSSR